MRQSGRPRLLDLFCGAGGAAMGYHRVGFEVVGVDIKPQPNYPFDFTQDDALSFLEDDEKWGWPYRLQDFDVIHASPPCKGHTSLSVMWNAGDHENLIPATRELLEATELPYIIENVVGARKFLREPFLLCGTMFELSSLRDGVYKQLRRHRLFEANWEVGLLPQCRHERTKAVGIYGDHLRFGRRSSDGELSGQDALKLGSELMGIDWMAWDELTQAIPPAYTEHIGAALLEHLNAKVAA